MQHDSMRRRRALQRLLLLPLFGPLRVGVAPAPISAAGSQSYRDRSNIALVPGADGGTCIGH